MQTSPKIARVSWFVILLPLFFILHGWKEHFADLRTGEVLELAAVYTAASLLLLLLCRLILKDWNRAALFSSLLMGVNLFFGPVQDFFLHRPALNLLSRYSVMFAIILVSLILAFAWLRKTRRPLIRARFYLNLLLLLLIGIDIISIAIMKPKSDIPTNASLLYPPCDTCHRPDIYFLLCDEFASSRSLMETWQFDNTAFDTALVRRGFHVIPHSRSNYNFTPFSVASILQMDYLRFPSAPDAIMQEDYSYTSAAILDNRVSATLKATGYRVINHSIFDLAGEPAHLLQDFLPLHTRLITAQTLLNRARADLGHLLVVGKFSWPAVSRFFLKQDADNTERVLQAAMQQASEPAPGPRFFYLHLFLPHLPYLYDSVGNKRTVARIQRDYAENPVPEYLGSVKYADLRLLRFVDSILARSVKPPVIVLMGDHGFRKQHPGTGDLDFFRNMNAVYLPSGDYSGFGDSLAAVNEFRVIFNSLYHKNVPLLPDSTIFLTDKGQHVFQGTIK